MGGDYVCNLSDKPINTNPMKRSLSLVLLIAICIFSYQSLLAQLNVPNVEDVYGGRIIGMAGISTHVDTSRIYITTESANSGFYADVYNTGSSIVFSDFTVMAGMDDNAGLGDMISIIAAHAPSRYLFYVDKGALYRTHPDSISSDLVFTVGVHSLLIKDSILLFLEDSFLHFELLAPNADNTPQLGSPLAISAYKEPPLLLVNPVDSILYIFEKGKNPKLYKFSDAYNALSSATTYADISPSLDPNISWNGAGIGPDGRIFFAGTDVNNKYIAYTDDESTWVDYSLPYSGMVGRSFAFVYTSGPDYFVYNSSMYNHYGGDSTYWFGFGTTGLETNANDGDVLQDPNFMEIVYMTTDQGIGASENYGPTIFEIDDGVEAVRVDDIDMTASKNRAWVASKSGVRSVTDYLSSPSWSNARYPNDDGSPYFSIAMDPADSNTIYAGNVRVYKTDDDGASWTKVFTPEDPPWNYPSFGMKGDVTKAEALEVCPYNSNIVMAGYYLGDSLKGGLFYSLDEGATWSQQLLEGTVDGEDVDVHDIIFNLEASDTVAYVGVEYDLDYPTGRSVYRLVKNGASWVVDQDMDAAHTTSGSTIVVTIKDLNFNAGGDTLFACGTDAGVNEPHVYYKDLVVTNKWSSLTSSGFSPTDTMATAITYGLDTLYCAVANKIYLMTPGSSSWITGYTYPEGTEINVLYYDELMVGTGTGLYTHTGMVVVTGTESISLVEGRIQVFPNPVNDQFTIVLDNYQDVEGISLWDIQGKVVMHRTNPNTPRVEISREGLKSGVYFLDIMKAGRHNVYKLIME